MFVFASFEISLVPILNCFIVKPEMVFDVESFRMDSDKIYTKWNVTMDTELCDVLYEVQFLDVNNNVVNIANETRVDQNYNFKVFNSIEECDAVVAVRVRTMSPKQISDWSRTDKILVLVATSSQSKCFYFLRSCFVVLKM